MGHELAFAALRQGELSAAEAWKLLSPLMKTNDRMLAYGLAEALRAWTWKALDRRRRDQGLREWVDLLNRVEGFWVDRFAGLAAKIELMAELLHESLAVAEIAIPEDLLRRKHVAPILRLLTCGEADWVDRGVLMEELTLKPANATRLMSLLVDIGWVEQLIQGRQAAYRISSEGLVRARQLSASEAQPANASSTLETNEWKDSIARVRTSFDHSGSFNFPSCRRTGAISVQKPWEHEAPELATIVDDDWDDWEESMVEPPVPAPPRVLVSAGGGW